MSNVPEGVACQVAKSMYEEGRNGIDIAEFWISVCVAGLIETQNQRAADPAAVPEWGPETTPHFAARRIVARLLDAGWTPPDSSCIDSATITADGGNA
ncbi:hypothetical protein [Streptomyces kaempferi]|jgi:hypothetical protein|uniref:Uncharacterized protein n=1 Tax=Streptomyces kaempferi TaxID=333725 RepID=A0ABW3XGP3_9ACTN